MGCRRDVPERETMNTKINPKIQFYRINNKNNISFKG
jgi:hypothetical protein